MLPSHPMSTDLDWLLTIDLTFRQVSRLANYKLSAYIVAAALRVMGKSMLTMPRRYNLRSISGTLCLGALISSISFAGCLAAEPVTPRFFEMAGQAGLHHVFSSGDLFDVGGGVAAFDCDADMDIDLFLAGGVGPAALYINTTEPGNAISFQEAGEKLALNDGQSANVTGAYALDFDNDGDMDLFVLRFGVNLLLENDGQCNFSIANNKVGIPDADENTTAFAAAWIADRPDPVLFVGNYLAHQADNENGDECAASYSLRFVEADEPSERRMELVTPSYCPLSYLLVDWSGRGQFDLRTANDISDQPGGVSEQLFRLGETLEPYPQSDDWRPAERAAAGIAARDIDGDGRPEIVVAGEGGVRFYSMPEDGEDPAFTEQAKERRLQTPAAAPAQGQKINNWHVEFADFNNDTLSDMFIVRGRRSNGTVASNVDHDVLLLGAEDGTFADRSRESGLALGNVGRGAAIADFDRDGCQDIVVVNRDSPVALFRNLHCDGEESPGWLNVELAQDGFNTHAVGASVILRAGDKAQTQARTIGGGHAGGASGPLHFGLGENQEAVLRVRWPDGSITEPIVLPANRHAVIRRSDQTITVNMGEQ